MLFSRMAGLDVSESLRLDALTYSPIFILLGSCISFFIPFINLDKTLLLLAGVGVCALKVRLMKKYSVLSRISERKFLVNAAVVFFLACLTLLFFWRILSNSPLHEGSISDDILVFFPFRFFAATTLRDGIIPLWNPFVFGGMPFLADSQAAVFHPVNLLLTLFVSAGSLAYKAGQYAVVINLFIAGLAMYFYARTIKLTPFGSLISALVFMFGGFLVAHIRHLPVLNVVVWLPLIFLFAEKALSEKRLAYSILGGLAFAASLIGGHLQMMLYVVFALALYIAFKIYCQVGDGGSWKEALKSIYLSVAIFVVALCLCSVQFLPTAELLPQTVRSSDVSYHMTTDFSFEFQNLVTFLVPNFFGGNPGRYWGPWTYWWEMCGYVGIFPLVLTLLALIFTKNRYVKFFAGLGAVSLFLAFGGHTFLHPVMYLFAPGFHLNRAPARFLYLLDFSLAILAGFGASAFVASLTGEAKQVLAKFYRVLGRVAIGAVVVAFFFYYGLAKNANTPGHLIFGNIVNGYNLFLLLLFLSIALIFLRLRERVNVSVIKLLVVALILFDLFTFGWKWYVEEVKPEEYYPQSEIVQFLQSDKDYFRVVNDGVLPVNAGAVYSIFTTTGSNPLSLRQYEGFKDQYDLLNVKYILSKKRPSTQGTECSVGDCDLVFSEGDNKVFQKRNVLPRALVVSDGKVVTNDAQTLALLNSPDFDPRRTVIISENLAGAMPVASSGPGKAHVNIDAYSPNEIRLSADLKNDGFLVLSEIYYPGWKAYVDGKEEKVYRANYLLRAVYLREGKHQVRMVFEPDSYKMGLRITLFTLAAVVLFLGFELGRWVVGRRSS
ncbi:MAG: YfhO family protein [Actinomycetota bacterium]|nr:YfhO family protein [Actinomycetota bacterium]